MALRARFVSGLLLLVASAVPGIGAAQDREPVYLSVTPTSGRVQLDLAALLSDRTLANAIHQGLPLRISVEAELWQDRFFDSEAGSEGWKASMRYDAVTLRYEVQVQDGASRAFATLGEARAHLQASFALDLRPTRPGRYYYLAVVEVETLSLSDLEELQRWLNGDLDPADGDEGGGGVGRGVRRLFVRALGLPTRRVRLRTESFSFGGAGG